MKVLLIGPHAPPFGGVSVFLKRHKRMLENEGHTVEMHDPTKLSLIPYYLKLFSLPFKRYNVISVNVQSIYVLLILFALGLAPRTQIVDHSWRLLESWPRYKSHLYRLVLKHCRELVLIGSHLKDYYEAHGVRLPSKTRVGQPFLPPALDEEAEILKTYSPEAQRFVAEHRPLLIANAPQIVFYRGVDLYGLDMCVELIAVLRQEFPGVGLLFAMNEIGDEDYYAKIKRRVAELGVAGNIYFMSGHRELWPLFKRADLMVRPTCTDAYGISVAEALYLNCPAVASDVCERAAGAVLFANRAAKDFLLKCREVLRRS
jgi:glycosyltransferase involved in cell wall biosynthesis